MKSTTAIFRRAGILLSVLLTFEVLPPALADEPPLALGNDILVPDVVEGDQSAPEVASAADGRFVAVWQSLGEDGDGFGVLYQVYDAAGAEVGAAKLAATAGEGNQTEPAVAVGDAGSFAIAWQGPSAEAGSTVYFRVFAPDGTPVTGQIVAPQDSGAETLPSVAFSEAGHLLVAWQHDDSDGRGIWGRLFAHDGTPIGGNFQLSLTSAGHQRNPQVRASDEKGGYMVAWEGPDADGSGIFVRELDAGGIPAGVETRVNQEVAGNQRNPSLALSGIDADVLDENVFVVAWQSADGSGPGIYARLYEDDGGPLSGEVPISENNGREQRNPSVTLDNGGDGNGIDFVVTWTEVPVAGLIGGPTEPLLSVRGRRLDRQALLGGAFAGGPNASFTVTAPGIVTTRSVVAAEDDGDFVVLWQSADQDGSGQGIFGKRFAGQPVFVDGFESGDTSRWGSQNGPDPNEPFP